mmetsp:Transcript_93062/g.221293  ORF Transcript_93062/g.221293 Transcript_93062/m.221293 type:complete len:315 (-) Transcript_93062:603-1547(-)
MLRRCHDSTPVHPQTERNRTPLRTTRRVCLREKKDRLGWRRNRDEGVAGPFLGHCDHGRLPGARDQPSLSNVCEVLTEVLDAHPEGLAARQLKLSTSPGAVGTPMPIPSPLEPGILQRNQRMAVNHFKSYYGISASTEKSTCQYFPCCFPPPDGCQSKASFPLAPEMLPQFCPDREVADSKAPRASSQEVLHGIFLCTSGNSFVTSMQLGVRFFDQGRPFLSIAGAAELSLLRLWKKVIQNLVDPSSILEKAHAIDTHISVSVNYQLVGIFADTAHHCQCTLQVKAPERPRRDHISSLVADLWLLSLWLRPGPG